MEDTRQGGWANPNDFSVVFRCTCVKFADEFIQKGSIKFNTPSSWVQYAIEKGEGRGDRLEGTIAMFHYLDLDRMIELNQKYMSCLSLIRVPYHQTIYLKNEYSLGLPCYCLYIMKNSLFECPNKEGKHRLSADIPASYFRDFMDNLTPEKVEKLSYEEKPALIIINDFAKFKERLMNKLLDIGLDESEIIISSVTYINFERYGEDGWWDFGQVFPKELLIKNKRFENQSEARIIINSDKEYIKDFLYNNPIELGPMFDIATIHKGYLYGGIRVEGTINIELLNRE